MSIAIVNLGESFHDVELWSVLILPQTRFPFLYRSLLLGASFTYNFISTSEDKQT